MVGVHLTWPMYFFTEKKKKKERKKKKELHLQSQASGLKQKTQHKEQ